MNVSDELLDKYFKNECTPEEKLLVINYLNEIDEFPDHLIAKSDWDNAADAPMSFVKSDQLFEEIKKQTFAKPKKLIYLKIVAAVAVIAIIFSIIFIKIKKVDIKLNIAKINGIIPDKIIWKSFVNYTDKIQFITLPDLSTVKVYPDGELSYALPFVKAKREIFLKGKGFFQVAKDKKHPFIVYAKGISTTALGTSFTITANDKSKYIKVRLHTGKVWVKSVDSSHHILTFSKVLLPGNELVYNGIKNEIKVILPNLPAIEKDSSHEINFKQVPLAAVFSALSKHYKVKISFNPTDLKEISFTGNLNLYLPLNDVLKEITELNKLNQLKTPEGYEIKK
ncbi:FecR family protein [Pedobacter mucosus]|uniref:FecR family protein n=1 Tax=Pedobacter mucosus TaxID=2895286 RepID=UPI001EE4027F|nr:FecR family protein [Pedobacter mucosus]UKT63494.1 FecR family protein [Pedobacter mucosus]